MVTLYSVLSPGPVQVWTLSWYLMGKPSPPPHTTRPTHTHTSHSVPSPPTPPHKHTHLSPYLGKAPSKYWEVLKRSKLITRPRATYGDKWFITCQTLRWIMAVNRWGMGYVVSTRLTSHWSARREQDGESFTHLKFHFTHPPTHHTPHTHTPPTHTSHTHTDQTVSLPTSRTDWVKHWVTQRHMNWLGRP